MEVNFKTKNEAVYELLRRDILQGKIKPREKIVISDLSRKFGFSEIPIREAVRKLESEGFLVITPHVGIAVSKIDPDEIIEFYLIRTELESLAAKLATPLINQEDLEYLVQKNREMELALEQNDCEALNSLNKEFHLKIYRAASRLHLYKFIVELWEKINWIRSVFFLTPQIAQDSLKEHNEIIEGLKKGDADLVAKLIRQQKQNSLKAIADRFF
ncbi:MAG: GntR family transcriptional regulator [Deltaproteobacteria bacterium]|nr:GntR family transcriptional regulator [Deltaproteobacteria bacterium]